MNNKLYNNQSGYSLVESLVCISLLGILIFLTSSTMVRLFYNPKTLLRNEALFIANKEIENAMRRKSLTDTTYSNENENLQIERKVSAFGTFSRVEVIVKRVNSPIELVKLSGSIKNEID